MQESVFNPRSILEAYLKENYYHSFAWTLCNDYDDEISPVIQQIRRGDFPLALQTLEMFLKKHANLNDFARGDFYFLCGLAHLGNNNVEAATEALVLAHELRRLSPQSRLHDDLRTQAAPSILSKLYPKTSERFFVYANIFLKNRKPYNALQCMLAAALYGHKEAKTQLQNMGITFEPSDNKTIALLNFSDAISVDVRYKILQFLYANTWIIAESYVKHLEALQAPKNSKLAGKIQRQILLNKNTVNSDDREIKAFIANANDSLSGPAKVAFGKLEGKFNASRNSAYFFPDDAFQAAELAVFTPSGAMFEAGGACMVALDVFGILPALVCWGIAIGLGVLAATVGQIAVPFLKNYFEKRAQSLEGIAERTAHINTAHGKFVKTEVERLQNKRAVVFPRKDYNNDKRLPGIHFFVSPPAYTPAVNSQSVVSASNPQFGM